MTRSIFLIRLIREKTRGLKENNNILLQKVFVSIDSEYLFGFIFSFLARKMSIFIETESSSTSHK